MIGADTTFLIQLELQELPKHALAHAILQHEVFTPNVQLAIVPQVIGEFIHIVTDPRRFQKPLDMQEAIARAQFWWNAKEVQHIFPTPISVTLALEWLNLHHLGRKRILDTQLAASLWTAGVRQIVTSNPDDFRIFGFETIVP